MCRSGLGIAAQVSGWSLPTASVPGRSDGKPAEGYVPREPCVLVRDEEDPRRIPDRCHELPRGSTWQVARNPGPGPWTGKNGASCLSGRLLLVATVRFVAIAESTDRCTTIYSPLHRRVFSFMGIEHRRRLTLALDRESAVTASARRPQGRASAPNRREVVRSPLGVLHRCSRW